VNKVVTSFKRHFGHAPVHLVRAPESLELLGLHAEAHQGLTLALAVNRYVHAASAPRRDGKAELVCGTERQIFWMSDLKPEASAPYTGLVKAVLEKLLRRGANFSGFSAAFEADLSPGEGLGSPAALAVAVALTVRRLYPFSLTGTGVTIPPKVGANGELPPLGVAERFHFAKLCQAAIHARGGSSGWIEPLVSIGSKAWHAISIDSRFETLEHLPLPGEVLVICRVPATPANHAATNGIRSDPNASLLPRDDDGRSSADSVAPAELPPSPAEILQQAEAAARKLSAKSLRSLELKFLDANRAKLTLCEFECARHFAAENARVAAAERTLRDDDHRQFGQFLLQSEQSWSALLRDRAPGLDLLFELARAHPACLGARVIGGNFGPATVNLVPHHQAESFMREIARRFEQRAGTKLDTMLCQIADGAEAPAPARHALSRD